MSTSVSSDRKESFKIPIKKEPTDADSVSNRGPEMPECMEIVPDVVIPHESDEEKPPLPPPPPKKKKKRGPPTTPCPHCSFMCRFKSELNRHLRSHTGEKPFHCPVVECTYSCSVKSSMVYHMRRHTGEKPFKCTQCPYSCTVRSSLAAHMSTHSEDKPFNCAFCAYGCAQKADLIKHNRVHSGERPYSCLMCPYECSRRSHLLRHTRTKHKTADAGKEIDLSSALHLASTVLSETISNSQNDVKPALNSEGVPLSECGSSLDSDESLAVNLAASASSVSDSSDEKLGLNLASASLFQRTNNAEIDVKPILGFGDTPLSESSNSEESDELSASNLASSVSGISSEKPGLNLASTALSICEDLQSPDR